MTISKVTDYIISYVLEHQIPCEALAKETGVPMDKLMPGYQEPLLADEFLKICVYLKLRPEDITKEI